MLPSSEERFIVCSEKENFRDYFFRLFSSFEQEYFEENSIRYIESYESVGSEIETFLNQDSLKKITVVILYDMVILEVSKVFRGFKNMVTNWRKI